ncbi:hypothetical protein PILCRDRAFT_825708 [Piloderma croceum F 1598]|uniref:DUF6534 domain-containing protein n=1 Tax=Piloderma croceum (strain F 1598) TaxID=765440 RepID=A0A0C3EXB2_PILCF|nr:hypothetical protein PILCRDRAFT_825708 [Piloderma croceum F 1598]
MSDISSTFGAMLLGGLVAVGLSGVLGVQTFVYLKLYSNDSARTKILVGLTWLLDTLHTCFVCAGVWYYLIAHFGDTTTIDFIPWSVALTVAITAVITLLVHCFYVHRIYRLTSKSWYFSGPIAVMAFLRLVAACVSTGEMIRIKTFTGFASQVGWVFTAGLSLSSAADICITAVLCYKLRTSRTASTSMNEILDSLVIYTLENGSLTSAATVASMICWVAMPQNKIFLAIHVAIAKLYANSLLATLLTRNQLRDSRKSSSHALPVLFSSGFEGGKRSPNRLTFAQTSRIQSFEATNRLSSKKPTTLQITVRHEQEMTFDDDIAASVSPTPPAELSAVKEM